MLCSRKLLARRALFSAALLAAGWEVRADDFTVRPVTFPAPFHEAAGQGSTEFRLDNVVEASGVQPIGNGRLLLVAHDKKVPLRVIETATGRQVGPVLTCDKFPAETPKSSKWEGMAQDSAGNFYLVGSHSGKTDDERSQHAKLIRFRLKPAPGANGSDAGVAIDENSVTCWRIAGPLVRTLQQDGISAQGVSQRKIEGLALREHGGPDGRVRRELVFGLRQPDDLVRTFAADITGDPAPDAELPLHHLFSFDAGEREGVRCQLTCLEYLPAWKGFLAVTATEDEHNVFHGNTLWFVPDTRISASREAPVQADRVWTFEVAMKAEGLCVLPQPAGQQTTPRTIHLLVTFDNDPHSTHIPSRYQLVNLSRTTANP
ncbi:MAG: hypothetical protein ACP5XB_13455 [Isosphaeraceae bacterium]